MKSMTIAVNTHGSPLLSKAVAAIFESVFPNRRWMSAPPDQNRPFAYVRANSEEEYFCVDQGGDCYIDAIKIDAATEMGKLIELLEAPKEVIIASVAKDANGLWSPATISSDGKTVKVGCSTSTFQKVEEVYLKMKSLRQ